MTRCLICADPVAAPGSSGKPGRLCVECLLIADACREYEARAGGVQYDIASNPVLCAEIRYRANGPCLLLGCGPNGFMPGVPCRQ